MVQGPANNGVNFFERIFSREPKQLMLPLDIPNERKHRLIKGAKDFATGFAPKLGASLLMKVGVPMVAATTPAVIRLVGKDHWEDEIVPNLLVGSALGGAWGAAVGALIPRTSEGVRISRVRSIGTGAAGGILLAPAVALASKYVADFLTAPLEKAKDRAEDRADQAERELSEESGAGAKTLPGAAAPAGR